MTSMRPPPPPPLSLPLSALTTGWLIGAVAVADAFAVIVAESFDPSESFEEVTLPAMGDAPATEALSCRFTSLESAGEIVPIWQLTVPAPHVQVPPETVADSTVTPAGRVTVAATLLEGSSPVA